jgi:hypothetical protein
MLYNPGYVLHIFLNYKLQITNYKQIPNSNDQNYKPFLRTHFGFPNHTITPVKQLNKELISIPPFFYILGCPPGNLLKKPTAWGAKHNFLLCA